MYFKTILDSSEIAKRNVGELGTLLSFAPGIWVGYWDSFEPWASMNILGSQANHLSLQKDGFPLLDPLTGNLDLTLVPIAIVKKIEIYPALNPFCLSPTGGLVNIITSDLPSNQPCTRIGYKSETGGLKDLDIFYGQALSSKWKILSSLNTTNHKWTRQNIRSEITFQPSLTLKMKYGIFRNQFESDLPGSMVYQENGDRFEYSHQKKDRIDHFFRVDGTLWKTETWLNLNHTRISYELKNETTSQKQILPVSNTSVHFQQRFSVKQVPVLWGVQSQLGQMKKVEGKHIQYQSTHMFSQIQCPLVKRISSIFQIHAHISPDKKIYFYGNGQLNWNSSPSQTTWIGYCQTTRDPSISEEISGLFRPSKIEHDHTVYTGIQLRNSHGFQLLIFGYLKIIQNIIEQANDDMSANQVDSFNRNIRGLGIQFLGGFWKGFSYSTIFNMIHISNQTSNHSLNIPKFWGNGRISYEHGYFKNDLQTILSFSARGWQDFRNTMMVSYQPEYRSFTDSKILFDFKIAFLLMHQATFSVDIDNLFGTKTTDLPGFSVQEKMIRVNFSWELFN
jgi:hypothetical protein